MNDLLHHKNNQRERNSSSNIASRNQNKSITATFLNSNYDKNSQKEDFQNKPNKIKRIIDDSFDGFNLQSIFLNLKNENKLRTTKFNIFMTKNEESDTNYYDYSKIVNSNLISENLKNKFSEVYSQAIAVDKNCMEKKNVPKLTVGKNNFESFSNNNKKTDICKLNYNDKINSKRQEILKLLDDGNENILNTTKKPKDAFTTKIHELNKVNFNNNNNRMNYLNKSKRNNKARSASVEYLTNNNNNYNKYNNLNNLNNYNDLFPYTASIEKKETTERILKMKSKLEKIIDGEFVITPLIESGDSFNIRSNRNKESYRENYRESYIENNTNHCKIDTSRWTKRLPKEDFNLNFNFNEFPADKKDSSYNSDIKKTFDMDIGSYYNDEKEKLPLVSSGSNTNFKSSPKNNNTNINFIESPITSENKKIKKHASLNNELNNNINNNKLDKNDHDNEELNRIDNNSDKEFVTLNLTHTHKRTKSALAELLPFKKEVISLDSERKKNYSLIES